MKETTYWNFFLLQQQMYPSRIRIVKNDLPNNNLGEWQIMKTITIIEKIRAKLSSFILRPIRLLFSEL